MTAVALVDPVNSCRSADTGLIRVARLNGMTHDRITRTR